MRVGARSIAALALLLAGIGPASADGPAGARPRKYALLVGCTSYPGLDRSRGLLGPANDVGLWKGVLTGYYGFAAADVRELTDLREGGGRSPTLANIRDGFEDLASKAAPGDQVVILLAGHGSQQPDADVPPDEADGWDEIFLPSDVGAWDGPRRTVAGALVDDEIGRRVAAISARGASVWLIVDSCCSGTMYRGNGRERQRWVAPGDLGVPAGGLARVAEKTRGAAAESASFELGGGGPGVVAFSAAQADETTPEQPFIAKGTTDELDYGLFSYSVCEALAPTAGAGRARTAPAALTYRGLMKRVQARYSGLSRGSPTPMIEGDAADRPVLDLGSPGESGMVLTRGPGGGRGWTLNAGQIQGLEAGAILSVHRPEGGEGPSSAIGHVKVSARDLRPLDASATPCDRDGRPTATEFPVGAICRPAYLPYGDRPLRIAVDPRDEDGRPVAEPARARLEGALRQAATLLASRGQHVLEVAESPAGAEFLLRAEPALGGRIYLVPGEGWPREDPARGRPPLHGPVPPDGRAVPWLEDNLMRVFVARRLKRVASDEERRVRVRPETSGSPRVAIELLRFEGKGDTQGRVVEDPGGGVRLISGEIVAFRLTNLGRSEVDVTLLFVDSGFGIKSLSFQDASGRFAASEIKTTRRFRVQDDTLGLESAIAIAVAAAPDQAASDFSFLEQRTLDGAAALGTRGPGGGARGFGSPLGRLLQNCCFGHGTRSSATPDELDDYQIRTLSWRTMTPAAPAK